MRCIYLSTSLPHYFSKCWLAYMNIFIETHVCMWLFSLTTCVLYVTILIETRVCTQLFPLTTRVLYATISIATRVHQHTQVSFKQLVCHTWVASINSRVHLHSTLKKYKSRFMEISWALIINHLNLRNYSISQSINRGLGEGINQSI